MAVFHLYSALNLLWILCNSACINFLQFCLWCLVRPFNPEMIASTLKILLFAVAVSSAPMKGRSTAWTPVCVGSEMDIKWPDYEDSSRYFECIFEYTPMRMYCLQGKLFSFMHQACVDASSYIPPPDQEHLPTEKPPLTTTSTTVLPTPKPQTTTPKLITTVGTKPQEITTTKKPDPTTQAPTTAPTTTTTVRTTTTTIITTTRPPTEPPATEGGRKTPPTSGVTNAPTTQGLTAKPPNTTKTATTKPSPEFGGGYTTPPPALPTPPHINEPLPTPPIS